MYKRQVNSWWGSCYMSKLLTDCQSYLWPCKYTHFYFQSIHCACPLHRQHYCFINLCSFISYWIEPIYLIIFRVTLLNVELFINRFMVLFFSVLKKNPLSNGWYLYNNKTVLLTNKYNLLLFFRLYKPVLAPISSSDNPHCFGSVSYTHLMSH